MVLIYEVVNLFTIINELAPNLWFLTEENFPVDVDYISKASFFRVEWIFPKSSLMVIMLTNNLNKLI